MNQTVCVEQNEDEANKIAELERKIETYDRIHTAEVMEGLARIERIAGLELRLKACHKEIGELRERIEFDRCKVEVSLMLIKAEERRIESREALAAKHTEEAFRARDKAQAEAAALRKELSAITERLGRGQCEDGFGKDSRYEWVCRLQKALDSAQLSASINSEFDRRNSSKNSLPIDMLLFCPNCGEQHIDRAKPEQKDETGESWNNPPHRSHRCDYCSWIWRPADVPTNGVKEIQTKGKVDQDPRPRKGGAGNGSVSVGGDIIGGLIITSKNNLT